MRELSGLKLSIFTEGIGQEDGSQALRGQSFQAVCSLPLSARLHPKVLGSAEGRQKSE